jgi:hypothetical protein
MALVFSNQGDVLALKALVNHTAGQDLYLKLFTNNVSPVQDHTEADYVEATGGGYSHKAITGTSWTFTAGATGTSVGTASYTTQTWTFTGALTGTATVYGYYVVQQGTGSMVWAEATSSPFTPTTNGDTFSVTLNLTANNA